MQTGFSSKKSFNKVQKKRHGVPDAGGLGDGVTGASGDGVTGGPAIGAADQQRSRVRKCKDEGELDGPSWAKTVAHDEPNRQNRSYSYVAHRSAHGKKKV
jgi:hypothetical protein